MLAPVEVQTVDFKASPVTPLYFGPGMRLPFNVVITAPSGETQRLRGELPRSSPKWVLAIPAAGLVLLVCAGLFAFTANAIARGRASGAASQTSQALQTDFAALGLDISGTQTAQAGPIVVVDGATPTPPPQMGPTPTEHFIAGVTPPSPTAPILVVAPTHPPVDYGDYRLTYAANPDGNWDVYIAKADGSDPLQLTDHPRDDSFPSWSPDGRKILFHSDRNGNYDIFVVNYDGTGLTQLTTNTTADTFPVWSPDGRRIAYQSRRDGNKEIFIMDADGSNQTQLTFSISEESWPTFSPDGSQLAYISDRDGNQEIYLLGIDSGQEQRLTYTDGHEAFPAWWPGGELIAFTYTAGGTSHLDLPKFGGLPSTLVRTRLQAPALQQPQSSQDIYVADLRSGEVQELTRHVTGEDHPRWSLDGRILLFDVDTSGGADIYICEPYAIGCNPRQLTRTHYDEEAPSLK
jgi:WD40 repeat protein